MGRDAPGVRTALALAAAQPQTLRLWGWGGILRGGGALLDLDQEFPGRGASEAMCISPVTLAHSVLLGGAAPCSPALRRFWQEASTSGDPSAQFPAHTLH